MSDVIRRLQKGRALAWADLVPVFDHAISLAREAEYVAGHAANVVMCGVGPVYPPLVQMLADSVREEASA